MSSSAGAGATMRHSAGGWSLSLPTMAASWATASALAATAGLIDRGTAATSWSRDVASVATALYASCWTSPAARTSASEAPLLRIVASAAARSAASRPTSTAGGGAVVGGGVVVGAGGGAGGALVVVGGAVVTVVVVTGGAVVIVSAASAWGTGPFPDEQAASASAAPAAMTHSRGR